jgi:hypothetical protein
MEPEREILWINLLETKSRKDAFDSFFLDLREELREFHEDLDVEISFD